LYSLLVTIYFVFLFFLFLPILILISGISSVRGQEHSAPANDAAGYDQVGSVATEPTAWNYQRKFTTFCGSIPNRFVPDSSSWIAACGSRRPAGSSERTSGSSARATSCAREKRTSARKDKSLASG
jgi:hypothetical protein